MLKLIKNTFENSFETSLNVCQRLHFTRSNFRTCFTVCNVYYAPNGHQKRSRFLDGISYWTPDDEWRGRERERDCIWFRMDLSWTFAVSLEWGKSVGFVVKSVHSHRSGFFLSNCAWCFVALFSQQRVFCQLCCYYDYCCCCCCCCSHTAVAASIVDTSCLFCTLLVSIVPIVPFRSHWTFHMVKVCVYVF